MSIDARDARIFDLEQLLRAALEENAKLRARIGELEARLGQNSQNSSKPPSTDGPGVERPKKKPTGRKRGGQPGHEGAVRTRLPPDRVVDHVPRRCRRCSRKLEGKDAHPQVFQVLEMPEIKPHVTEHRGHTLKCECGTRTTEPIPTGVLQHGFGPRFSAFVAYFTGRCRLSKRQVVELCDELLGAPISLGAVCAVEQDVSAALKTPYEEAAAAIQRQAVASLDETGWREAKLRAWLWVAVTSVAVVFKVSRSRGAAVAKELLGVDFAGVLVTDRWSAYAWVKAVCRQLCWAHLQRDLAGMIERGGVGGGLATQMLDHSEKMFEWWSQVRDGSLSRVDFQRLMVPVRAQVGRLLRDAQACAESKTAGMCAQILKLEPALWTFVDVEGVEPTNNIAERTIRPAVLWRKGCFGNDSAVGSRFTERILTTVATVRLRRGSVLQYLAAACASYRANRTSPSLLEVMPVG